MTNRTRKLSEGSRDTGTPRLGPSGVHVGGIVGPAELGILAPGLVQSPKSMYTLLRSAPIHRVLVEWHVSV